MAIFSSSERVKLLENFIALLIIKGMQIAIPLLTLPYQIETIGLSKYGAISFASSVCVYFGVIIQYGFNLTSTKEIAISRSNRSEISAIYSETFYTGLTLALLSAAIFSISLYLLIGLDGQFYLYLICFLLVATQSLIPFWFFQGVELMRYMTFISLTGGVLYALSLFHFVKSPEDYILIPSINLTIAILTISASIAIVRLKLGIKFAPLRFSRILSRIRSGRSAFLSQIAPNLYNSSPTIILGIAYGNQAVGAYTAAMRVIDVTASMAQLISSTFIPRLSRSIKGFNEFNLLMWATGALICLLIAAFSQYISIFLFRSEHNDISWILLLLSPGVFLQFVNRSYLDNYLMITGHERIASRIVFNVSILFCVVAVFGVYAFGILGAVFSITLARLALAVTSYYTYRRIEAHKS